MTEIRKGVFRMNDLRFVAPAPPPDNPPLAIGDTCILNSGSPSFLIVDADETDVTVSWRDPEAGAIERKIPRACVRRKSRA